ncbi:ParB/RepB/Spo0J family partition protein [Crossiella sp. CA198]|uniref:ParB/RepB/Spo0J family partition protein n=1 Tax=Crossiella sp. CA198 TaxID=3455607 RepID=UPI003F8D7526
MELGQQERAQRSASWPELGLVDLPVRLVAVSALRAESMSPRQAGENIEHVRLLADSTAELPPILVHRSSMRVIDGMHRLLAAVARGRGEVEACFFDGPERDAFVLAVRANIAHGLPLSAADRSAAAGRILRSHPEWSDRLIAKVAGLSPGTVAGIRQRDDRAGAPLARIGRDGRARPMNSADGRRKAGELFAERPTASLREVAKAAGVAVSTAQDVRRRVRAGEDPVPAGLRARARPAPPPARSGVDRENVLQALRADPSLRFNQSGKLLLRWLDAAPVPGLPLDQVVAGVPDYRRGDVAELAMAAARAWQELAIRLRRNAR